MTILELGKRHIPQVLVNGRISDRTWKRLGGTLGRPAGRELYGLFSKLLLREERDAERLRSLGIEGGKIRVCGDSKIDALLGARNIPSASSYSGSMDGDLVYARDTEFLHMFSTTAG